MSTQHFADLFTGEPLGGDDLSGGAQPAEQREGRACKRRHADGGYRPRGGKKRFERRSFLCAEHRVLTYIVCGGLAALPPPSIFKQRLCRSFISASSTVPAALPLYFISCITQEHPNALHKYSQGHSLRLHGMLTITARAVGGGLAIDCLRCVASARKQRARTCHGNGG